MESPIIFFKNLEEPRMERCRLHSLEDIIFLTIAAVLSGADNFVEVESFGIEKKEWLLKFLKLENGTPSHDTIGRLFAAIDADLFEQCFILWMQSVVKLTAGQVIAIDGKTLRGSSSPTNGKKAIHMVSAFASANKVVLGQLACAEKSNEITAIPALLELIVVKGCIVTIDAMGCQTDIAKDIIKHDADYILAVKDNQKRLHKEVQEMFSLVKPESFETLEKNSGRIEARKCSIIINLKKMNAYVREHWCVENNLHWSLDVSFNEDANRTRRDNSAENLSIIRRVGLNLLKTDTTLKIGIAAKRKAAGWNTKYLEAILNL